MKAYLERSQIKEQLAKANCSDQNENLDA